MVQDDKNGSDNFTILYIGHSRKRGILSELESDGLACQFVYEEDGEKALTLVDQTNPDVILVDFDHSDFNPLVCIEQLLTKDHDSCVVGLTRRNPVDLVVKAMKLGVRDVIHTNGGSSKLKHELSKMIEKEMDYKRGDTLHQTQRVKYDFHNIVGQCPEMQNIFKIISKISRRKWVTVLILGETGTGKEVIARAIHYKSNHHYCPFVEINCSTLPENLLESELFGYEKGAFTDVRTQKKGLFEMAHNGTLFLDEIGEISGAIQMKLLKAIENKKIRRLGGTEDIFVNTRIIAATNRELQAAVLNGLFRRDLFYRLNVISVSLPPLRKRRDDVILLAHRFLREYGEEYDSALDSFTPEAERFLLDYDWPGNVRELKHIIERIVLLNDMKKGKKVEREVLEGAIEYERHLDLPGEKYRNTLKIAIPPNGLSLDDGEKILISAMLERTGWNKSQTCGILHISRPRLDRKILKYNLEPDWNN